MDDTLVEQTLVAFAAFIDSEGLPPTVRELADLLGVSNSPAHYRLQRLHAAGYIERRAGARLTNVVGRPWILTAEGRAALEEIPA